MHELIRERIQFIIQHATVLEERINSVKDAESLVSSKEGEILLDSLITRLQALSENFKQIQKINPSFFQTILPLDTRPIIRFRDLASHHYESLNHVIIYSICKDEVPFVKSVVQKFLEKETPS